MAVDSSGATTTIGASCTHYAGAEVTITVPASGMIVVTSMIRLIIDHTSGIEDRWLIMHGTSATDCPTGSSAWWDEVPSTAPTDTSIARSAFVQNAYSVTAGTYTYYVNGFMSSGSNAGDVFWFSNTVAVFYPS